MSRRPPELIGPKRGKTLAGFFAREDPDMESCRDEVSALKQEVNRLNQIVIEYENRMLKDALPEAPHDELRMSKKNRKRFNSRVTRKIKEFKKELQKAIDKMEED